MLPLFLALTAHAQDCDSKALVKELTDAGPPRQAAILIELAGCDPAAATKAADTVVPNLLTGDEAAAVVAIDLGKDALVLKWLTSLQSDERAKGVKGVGDACKDNDKVQKFFVGAKNKLGDDFWKQRWYGALTECRVPVIQTMLFEELKAGLEAPAPKAWTYGVMETYSRSVGGAAVPQLKAFGEKLQSEESLLRLVDAFSDAAGVGSLEGMDAKAAEEAVKAIRALAPNWPEKVVEQARLTCQALGDERAADELAAVRYKAVATDHGFLWGAVVVEDATCKNGKAKQRIHVARVYDPGQTWPDQVEGKVNESVEHAWDLNLAGSCKGEGGHKLSVPVEPFADDAAFDKWVKETIKAAAVEGVKPQMIESYEPIQL